MSAHIYTVPVGVPFLDAVARAVLKGDLPRVDGPAPDALSLPDITILLPTRRAARAAQDAFLTASGKSALLMPDLRPIAATDEDLSLLSGLAAPNAHSAADFDLPPAVDAVKRTLTLMQLVEAWAAAMARRDGVSQQMTPAQSANLAVELAGLMDQIERENISLSALEKLVPEAHAEHWQKTVEFLQIATVAYPAILAEDNLTSPAARTNALIMAEAARLQNRADDASPVIVAGVTGSIPATVELMRAVASSQTGAIVLPGLDQTLDDASFDTIATAHPEHPQYGLKKLLDALGVSRHEVRPLPGTELTPRLVARQKIVSEALRPSATTAMWHTFIKSADAKSLRSGLENVSLIETPNAQDEAEVVSLILREAVETPGRTAALVSPDRLLARRVAIRLETWGIKVDDSAGRPFAKTVPGTLLALVVDAVRHDFAPSETMALLRHPLCRLALKAFDVRRFGRATEIMAFRAPYLGRGLAGIAAALEKSEHDRLEKRRQHSASTRLWDEDRAGAHDLVARLAQAFAPLTALYDTSNDGAASHQPLSTFAAAHVSVAEALATLDDAAAEETGAPHTLWSGIAGETALAVFERLIAPESPAISIRPVDYADLYQSLVARENVRERSPVHPRVSIWGPFEARLQQPDVIVLGSLNDGTWPEAAEPGAWLNRPMRAEIGLPQPEEEIGRAAHDFCNLLGADRVYLTRAEKIKGVPAVASRWLMRLDALLKGLELDTALAPDQPWLEWARARDAISDDQRLRIDPPSPCPPVALRPRRMSVTAVEDWIRNPYSVFARAILKLEPLPPLGLSPDQSLRGALVHDVLSQAAVQFPNQLPDTFRTDITHIARQCLQLYTGHPRVAAFWLPRLERFLSWFAETEVARRQGVTNILAETTGTLMLIGPAGPFTLTARADRIDVTANGIIITDYKTGSIPQAKAVLSGRSPQLPLEAAIALGDTGFPGVANTDVLGLRFIRASGGEPPGEDHDVKCADLTALANDARAGLERLIALYDDPTTPYRAVRRPDFKYDYDAYAHLARVAEWSAHVDTEDAA